MHQGTVTNKLTPSYRMKTCCFSLTILCLLQKINFISNSFSTQVSLSFYGKHFRLANILSCFVRLLLKGPNIMSFQRFLKTVATLFIIPSAKQAFTHYFIGLTFSHWIGLSNSILEFGTHPFNWNSQFLFGFIPNSNTGFWNLSFLFCKEPFPNCSMVLLSTTIFL